jgi:hypothetical protein
VHSVLFWWTVAILASLFVREWIAIAMVIRADRQRAWVGTFH